MATTITRIYEDDPGEGGTNFQNTELSLDTANGVQIVSITYTKDSTTIRGRVL